jgi:predicted amidohydrolase YtcJ
MHAPLFVIQGAVTLMDPSSPDTSKPFPPNPLPMTIEQAIRAMTIDAAWQLRMEDKAGSLEVGKYADLVVLDRSPLHTSPQELSKIEVLATMMGGAR